MKPEMYILYSGGAEGADMEWDKIGREFGLTQFRHFRPVDLQFLSIEQRDEMLRSVKNAAIALGRPHFFRGIELVQRNWLQIQHPGDIYAIGRIVQPDETDFKGFKNKTGKQIVAGGTGWAVEMGIQMSKTTYVFDMGDNEWKFWSYVNKCFSLLCDTPELTFTFTGIGSRELTDEGKQAIYNVYNKAING